MRRLELEVWRNFDSGLENVGREESLPPLKKIRSDNKYFSTGTLIITYWD